MSMTRQTPEVLPEERSDTVILGRYGGFRVSERTYDSNSADEVAMQRGDKSGSKESNDFRFAGPSISGMKVRNSRPESLSRRILMVDFVPVARLDY
jgi:hypothetical protein